MEGGLDATGGPRRECEEDSMRWSGRAIQILQGLVLALLGLGFFCLPSDPILNYSVTLNPYGTTPLAGVARLECSRPVKVERIQIEGGYSQDLKATEYSKSLEVPILGLRANKEHTVRLLLSDRSGATILTEARPLRTEPLPPQFPTISCHRKGRYPTLGFILHDLSLWEPNQVIPDTSFITIVDTFGEVVWYQQHDSLFNEIKMLPNGRLMILDFSRRRIVEMDLLGRVFREFQAVGLSNQVEPGVIPVETDTFHHDFVVDAQRDWIWTLGTRRRGDKIDDLVIAFDGKGRVRKEISLMNLLEPNRVIYPAAPGLWSQFYDGSILDWGHANSLAFDSTGQRALVSLRHQDAVAEINLEAEQVLWILASDRGWSKSKESLILKPLSGTQLPHRQHSAKWASNGGLLLFDNGRTRSRVVSYLIDLTTRTAEQKWVFQDDKPFFSSFLSDVDELPPYTLQITDGGRQTPTGTFWARILEVQKAEPREKILELVYKTGGRGCSIYRSQRIKDLYRG